MGSRASCHQAVDDHGAWLSHAVHLSSAPPYQHHWAPEHLSKRHQVGQGEGDGHTAAAGLSVAGPIGTDPRGWAGGAAVDADVRHLLLLKLFSSCTQNHLMVCKH